MSATPDYSSSSGTRSRLIGGRDRRVDSITVPITHEWVNAGITEAEPVRLLVIPVELPHARLGIHQTKGIRRLRAGARGPLPKRFAVVESATG